MALQMMKAGDLSSLTLEELQAKLVELRTARHGDVTSVQDDYQAELQKVRARMREVRKESK